MEVFKEIAEVETVLQTHSLVEGDAFKKKTEKHARRHEHQQRTEKRINTADNLVNGQDGGNDVIHENDANPDQHQSIAADPARCGFGYRADGSTHACGTSGAAESLLGQTGKQIRRRTHEHDADQYEQNQGEDVNQMLDRHAQIAPGHRGNGSAVIADGDHPAAVIMHRTGKNTADHNPQHRDRPVQRAENRAENRAGTGDIEELDQPDFDFGHRHIIHAIGTGMCGGKTLWLDAKDFFNKCAINEIPADQQGDTEQKH